ncbi:hypothetical protein QQF64_030348 [Cirrhinus molitorella]|uniref:Uncharacterized protein n=1 Tax=Cirrhinus molitorella TaxID=172907 RepID=A0ABR3N3E8_9TELE
MQVPFISKQGAENAALISSPTAGRRAPALRTDTRVKGREMHLCLCVFSGLYLCNQQKAAMSNTPLGLVGCEWACSVPSLKH